MDALSIVTTQWPEHLFTVRLSDLGMQDSRLSGILTPEPELGAQRVGITDQFLANADVYHAKYSNEGHFASQFRNAFEALGGAPMVENVLDIGTGSGVNTIGPLLAQLPGCQVVATDLSPDLLRILRTNLVRQNLQDRVACVCVDAMRDYFRPSSFDLVVGAAILHHLMDPIEALSAAYRALKPGGVAIWFEPFEPGIRMVRLLYELILREHENGRSLDEQVVTALRALVLDADTRAGTDKSAPHFRYMDDKWLFTRSYIVKAAQETGFEFAKLISHSPQPDMYRSYVTVEMNLVGGIRPEALPNWAWDLIDLADQGFTEDAKRDMPHEATIIFRKPEAPTTRAVPVVVRENESASQVFQSKSLSAQDERADLLQCRLDNIEKHIQTLQFECDRSAALEGQLHAVRSTLLQIEGDRATLERELQAVYSSNSWLITKPFRAMRRGLGQALRKG